MNFASHDFSHLSLNARVEMIEALWESLLQEQADFPIAQKQWDEIDKRIAASHNGQMVTVSIEDMLARIRAM